MSMKDFISTLSEEQKKALMDALMEKPDEKIPSQHLPDSTQETSKSKDNNFIVDTKKPQNNRRREPVKARKNEWTDTGEDRHIETKYGARTPRSRESHKKMDVECSVCGRSFKVDPKYVFGEYHRCSKCTGR